MRYFPLLVGFTWWSYSNDPSLSILILSSRNMIHLFVSSNSTVKFILGQRLFSAFVNSSNLVFPWCPTPQLSSTYSTKLLGYNDVILMASLYMLCTNISLIIWLEHEPVLIPSNCRFFFLHFQYNCFQRWKHRVYMSYRSIYVIPGGFEVNLMIY